MIEQSCEEFEDLSAEFALGVLQGRERAEALAYLKRCPACRGELLSMSELADRIVSLTPTAEPPVGFETQVLTAIYQYRRIRTD